MRVAVITRNRYLGQKIYLALIELAEVTVSRDTEPGYDLYVWDVDTVELTDPDERTVTVSYSSECNLRLPCSFEDLRALLTRHATSSPALSLGQRRAYIRGEEIKLTELEYALLKKLMDAGGGFVSRESILRDVWHGEAEAGIINVYVHYLRTKLERGEKIILSSRSAGYKIDEKFLK